MAGRDSAGVAASPFFGEMHDHVGGLQRAHGFQRHQLGVARADADPDQRARRLMMRAVPAR